MNASQFLDFIHRSDQLEKSDFLQLRKVQENFPYFQISHVLAARYEALKNPSKKPQFLGYAALSSPDRIWLREFIEKQAGTSSNPETKAKEDLLPEERDVTPDQTQRTESLKRLGDQLKGVIPEDAPKPKKRKPPKDDLIESIRKKEKKTISDSKTQEQIDLIRAFSKKDIKLATIKEIEANQNTENLAEPSTQLNEKIITESFARILIRQGKKEMAKEIYEKLSLKFPDKRTYFADLIEKLKE
jgi:hypothetical protein